MSKKITFIGAGSIGFTRRLLSDLLAVPELQRFDYTFMDINPHNLEMVAQLCRRDIEANGLTTKLNATLDRREALKDASYVFCVVRIGGLEAFETDIEIPLKYGVDQCVGDTLCAGGIMYGQRGIAALLDFCRDIREVAARDCILFNYANPMAMLTWACNKYGGVRTIGLCHGVQHTHSQIAEVLGVDRKELDVIAAGINHQTWFVSIKHQGEDMTGRLLAAYENHPKYSQQEKVRIDMLRRFGFYSTESNGHLSEYVPWYRKNEEEIRKIISLDDWILGETGGYLRVCTEGRNWFETDFPNWLKADPERYVAEKRSNEHGSHIIEALETGRVYRGHFNIPNRGAISNLAADAIVEVPAYVDRNGINVPLVGDLPMGCAAVCQQSINVQRLAVEAAVHGNDTFLRQAMMLDPLTGALLTPPQIWQMVDEMLVAQAKWLPQYGPAIEAAKKRLANGPLLPTRTTRGAARVDVKTIDQMRENAAAATRNAAAAAK